MGLLANLYEALSPLFNFYKQQSLTFQIIIGLIAFVSLSVVVNVANQMLFKDPNKPPLVFHFFPFIGSTISYGMEPYKFFLSNKKKYGDTFTFILLGRKMTVCLGPKGNDFVFNGKLANVCAEDAYTHLTTPVFGTDVVYDVPNHVLMDQKRFMKFGLTTETFKSYAPVIHEECRKYFQSRPEMKQSHGKISLSAIIPELTIFTAGRSLQGKEVREGLSGHVAKLYHDLDAGFTPMNFMFPWFPFPQNKARDSAQRQMAQFYMNIIKKRRQTNEQGEPDMIWNLMNQKYKDGRSVPDKEIAHMMIALLMAGQHTSMATSIWMLLHVAEKPDIQERLLEEQKKVFGQELRPLQYESYQDLPLHNFVIKEVLRLHPPLHSIMRKVKSPMQVPGTRVVVPDDHYVMAAPGVSAIEEEYFSNPLDFDPDRWAGQKDVKDEDDEKFDFGFGLISKGTASPYLPFGAGRHRCIGEQFANVQLTTILATVIRNFKLNLPKGTGIPAPDYSSLIAMPPAPSIVEFQWRNFEKFL